MQVFEVLSEDKLNVGDEVTIEGIFVMERGVGYFVQSKAQRAEKASAVMVDYPGLEKHLLSTVPSYGGSAYSYCDDAIITGTLKTSPRSEFPIAIEGIHNFVIHMFGETMVAIS